jgi:chitodextrinase
MNILRKKIIFFIGMEGKRNRENGSIIVPKMSNRTKVNRLLLIIALFLFAVIMGSCGNVGGGNVGGGNVGGGNVGGGNVGGGNVGGGNVGGGNVDQQPQSEQPSPKTFTLKVEKFGKGVIIGNGINCGEDCSEVYPEGTTIVLTAVPSSGYELKYFVGCDTVTDNSCTVTLKSDKIVLPTFAQTTLEYQPYFKMLDDSTMRDFVRQEGDIYYFNLRHDSPVLNLRPGDVIASTAGEGFLRRVEAVSISGNLIEVKTLSATLEDAIKQGTITFTKKLTYGDLQSSIALTPGVRLQRVAPSSVTFGEFEFEVRITCDIIDRNGLDCLTSRRGDITLIGKIKFTPELDIAIDVGLLSGIREFKFVLITNNLTTDISMGIGKKGEFDKKIPIYKLYFVPFAVGPVVIIPEGTIYARIKGEAEGNLAASALVEIEYIKIGSHYEKERGWRGIRGFSLRKSKWLEPTLNGSSSIKGSIGTGFSAKIFGVVGPEVGLEYFLKLKAEADSRNPEAPIWWRVYHGFGAEVEAEAEILGWVLAKYTSSFNLFEKELTSGRIESIVDRIPPSKPTGLSASVISATEIKLSWNESRDNIGVKEYKIYRDGAFIKSVPSPTAYDTGLNPETRYCYTVSALDNNGNESERSDMVCITTPPLSDTIPPTTPQLLYVTAISSSQIDLTWSVSTDNVRVSGYIIYRNGIPIRSLPAPESSGTQIEFSDKGVSPSTRYCYRISAFDSSGNKSDLSNEICVTTPGGIIITEGILYITLVWEGGDTSDMDLHLNYYDTTNPGPTTPIKWYVDYHIGIACTNPPAITFSDALDVDGDGICDIGLDWDDVDGYGPEHIVATKLPAGYYVISVNSYDLDRDPYAKINVTVKIGDSLFGPYVHTFTKADREGQDPDAWFRVVDIRVNTDGTIEVLSPNDSLKPWHSSTAGAARFAAPFSRKVKSK